MRAAVSWSAAGALIATGTAVGSYAALFVREGGESPGAWMLFAIHLLSALLGLLASAIASYVRGPSWLIGMAICGYILLFQLTHVVPAPVEVFR